MSALPVSDILWIKDKNITQATKFLFQIFLAEESESAWDTWGEAYE